MEIAAILARLAQYLGAALAFGWPLFARATQAAPPPRTIRLAGAIMMAAGATAALGAQTVLIAGELDAPDIWLVIAETAYGHGVAIRLTLSLALVAAVAAGAPRQTQLALSMAATASLALTGHAAAGEGLASLFGQFADAAHALAAAAWIGSLLALMTALRRSDATSVAETHAQLARFSGLGSLVVATLVLTGLVNSASTVGLAGMPLLTVSAYGRVLGAKLTLFAVMVGCAAVNRFVLTPALGAGPASLDCLRRRLRLNLTVETAAGVAVLLLAATLGLIPPIAQA